MIRVGSEYCADIEAQVATALAKRTAPASKAEVKPESSTAEIEADGGSVRSAAPSLGLRPRGGSTGPWRALSLARKSLNTKPLRFGGVSAPYGLRVPANFAEM